MLHREGVKTAVSAKFYRVVIQTVMLFGADNWVSLAPMAQRLEVFHVGFLIQVTNLKGKSLRDRLLRKVEAEKVLQG